MAAVACSGGIVDSTTDAAPSVPDASATDALITDAPVDAGCSSLKGTLEPGVAPLLSELGPLVARDRRTLFGVGTAQSCRANGGPAAQLTRVRAKASVAGAAGPPDRDRADLCFGESNGVSAGTVLVAYSATAKRIGAVALLPTNYTANILVGIVPDDDPAWSATPVFSDAQKFSTYPELGLPDAGDAGLISGERVAEVAAAVFLGSSLLVVGQSGQAGLSVLFKATGESNPRALAGTALLEARVNRFQAAATISSGGAWLAGPTPDGRLGIVKLTQDNALDETFGAGGFVEVGDVGQGALVHAIGVDALGRVIVVSTSNRSDAYATGLATTTRVTPNGAVDPSFGVGGIAEVPLVTTGDRGAGFSVIVEPSGGTLIGGNLPPPQGDLFSRRAAIVRIDRDGKLDPAFGGPGSGGRATAPVQPGHGPDDQLSPGGVAMVAVPQSDSCMTEFFAIFSQQGGQGYLFE